MRHDIPDDARQLLIDERRLAIERANRIARMLGMALAKVDRAERAARWRADDGEREAVMSAVTSTVTLDDR